METQSSGIPEQEEDVPSPDNIPISTRDNSRDSSTSQAPVQIHEDAFEEENLCTVKKKACSNSGKSALKRRKDDNTKIFDLLQKRSSEREKILHEMSSSKNDDADPLLLFFKSMAMTVKTFEPQLIAEAKARIFGIVNELEIRSLQTRTNDFPPIDLPISIISRPGTSASSDIQSDVGTYYNQFSPNDSNFTSL